MKRLLFIAATCSIGISNAQMLKTKADCDVQLQIQSENGNNGLGVTYDAKNKLYYTAFAGNMSYPLEVFSESGTLQYSTELGVDARGLWYNSSSKKLEGFAYDNGGWFQVTMKGTGSATTVSTGLDAEKTYGEDGQAVGAYCEKLKSVLFVSDGQARFYKKPGATAKTVALSMTTGDQLNFSPMYTGVKGKEIALFNFETFEVEFYSASSGAKTGAVLLDLYACSDYFDVPVSFRVSYANGKVWLYDTETRMWMGFSVWA